MYTQNIDMSYVLTHHLPLIRNRRHTLLACVFVVLGVFYVKSFMMICILPL